MTSVRRSKSPLKRRLPQPRSHTSLQEYTVILAQGNILTVQYQYPILYWIYPISISTVIHQSYNTLVLGLLGLMDQLCLMDLMGVLGFLGLTGLTGLF